MVILSSQMVRHCYVRYYLDKKSVLDRYNKKDIDYRIERTSSIGELTKSYEDADRKVKELKRAGAAGSWINTATGTSPTIRKKNWKTP